MSECKCTTSVRVFGDGCRYCQPQGYIDMLHDWIDEARAEAAQADELAEALDMALDMALEWIDAVPDDTTLPAMPGFDRDCVDDLRANYRKSKGE